MTGLFSELKRRNVFRVTIAYAVVSWIILQFSDLVLENLGTPDWVMQVIMLFLLIGLPIAVFFAWVYELTPEGLKPTGEVTEEDSVRATTGQTINRAIIGLMAIAILFLVYDRNQEVDEKEATIPASLEVEYTVAVLPFADMSADGSREYFGDGMAEEILNVLATIDDLSVTSRTTAFSLKGTDLSVPQIAERLGVNYIVEGSIRSDGDQIRVTAQLIDVQHDEHLWSETFDRELKGIFAIQDEISLAIADALKVELLGDRIGVIPTENMAAYDLYLQAISKFDVPDNAKILEARALLSRALELDEDFAEAWESLADTYGYEITYGNLNEEQIESNLRMAQEAATRATLLNPNLVGAWTVAAEVSMQRFEWSKAMDNYERAIRISNGSDGQFSIGMFYTAVGWFDDAVDALEMVVAKSPEASVAYSILGRAYISDGQIDKGIAALNTSINMDYGSAHINMALVHLMNGDAAGAKREIVSQLGDVQLMEELLKPMNLSPTEFFELMVDGYFAQQLREKYRKHLPEREFRTLVTGSMLLWDSEHLTRWLKDSSYNSYLIITYLFSPPFRGMLNQTAMKDYIHSTGLPAFWRSTKWPDFCRPLGNTDFECEDVGGNYP